MHAAMIIVASFFKFMKLRALTILFGLLVVSSASAQVYSVNTLVGSAGAPGSVDASGASARFNGPAAISVDLAGNIIVGEANSAKVRKITPSGVVSSVATLANNVTGLTVDSAGNIYVVDSPSHVIRRVAANGTISVVAGEPGVAGSADGGSGVARFNSPQGIARDAAGNLFVTDGANHTIRKITTLGTVSTVAGLAGISGFVDGAGPIARFNSPTGIAIDPTGNIFIADTSNYLIRKISPAGEVSTLAGIRGNSGGADGGPGTARFYSPQGVTIDAGGSLYVADTGNSTIRKITAAGVVSTIVGLAGNSGSADGIGSNARFYLPRGVSVDASGNILVADTGNHTIRKATFLPPPTIGGQPADMTVAAGQNATFGVTASGSGVLTYQWQRQAAGTVGFIALTNSGSYSGATSGTLTVNATTVAMNGDQFRCVVGSDAGPTTSAPALLAVTAPLAWTSASSAVFYAGRAGTFTFLASGSPAPTFAVTTGSLPSWASLNATTGLLSGTPPSTAGSPYAFTISASNGIGSAVSQSFTLVVQPPPVTPTVASISSPRQLVAKGQSLTLSVSASGTAPFSYQWKRNGFAIAGATSANYPIVGATARDGGYYQAIITNAAGSVTSAAIFVSVTYGTTEVVRWGQDVAVPAGLTSVVAVSAGSGHNLALNSNGTVVGWGNNDYGQATIPAGLSSVVAVSAGGSHSLALKSDGTVVAWGYSDSGRTTVPDGLSGVVAIAAGQSHSLALKGDGTVVAWGNNSYGQASVPADLSGVVAIAAFSDSLALRGDGTLKAWGNYNGYSPPATLNGVVAIALGSGTGIAVKLDGSAVAWGSSSYGLLEVVTGLSGVERVALSNYQAVAQISDGSIITWGANYYNAAIPTPGNLRSVVGISAGYSRLALRDASNDLPPVVVTSPASAAVNVGQAVTFAAAITGGTASLNYQWFKDGVALTGATTTSYTINGATDTNAGNYYVVASNSLGSVQTGTATLSVNSSPVVSAATGGRYPLVIGQSLTLALSSSISPSATVQWRQNGRPIAGATGRTFAITNATMAQGGYYQAVYNEGAGPSISAAIFVPILPSATQVVVWGGSSYENTIPAGLTSVSAVAARSTTTLALKADGTVVRWGGYYGTTVPAGLANIVGVAVGYSHDLALRADGTVVTWGESYNSAPPVPGGLGNVVAVAAGAYHSLALKGDGTVEAWGTPTYGATSVPAGLSNVVGIAAGDGFSLALRSDGTVVGWGRSSNGESTVPVGLSDVVAIAADTNFSVALKSDGTVTGWGYNGSYGSSGPIYVPPGLSGVTAIAAGGNRVIALKEDGTITAWSANGSTSISVPTDWANVVAVAAGSSHFVGVRDASGDHAPVISAQPASVAAYSGQNVNLSVGAGSGTAPRSYQWRFAGIALTGATNANLVIPAVGAGQAGSYDVAVSNYLGTVLSQPATVTVNATAAVSTSPSGRQLLTTGGSLTLTGASALPGPLTYQWRRNGQPIPGATASTFTISNATWTSGGVYQLVATNSIGPAVSAPVFVVGPVGGQIRAWGDNGSGQTSIPVGLADVVAVAAGYNHSLALKSDGTVVAWGSNTLGQCNIPSGLANVVAIAAGNNFSMSLSGDGRVTTWGAINYTPMEANGVTAIAASAFTSVAMALRQDGTVVAWDSSNKRTDVPAGLGNVVAIASGSYFNVALVADGSVVQWGNSGTGVTVPAGLANVVAISSGYSHVLALKGDGTVVSWGYSNYNGETAVPANLSGVVGVVAGNAVSFALKSNGTVVNWGSTTVGSGAASLAPAIALSAGYAHAVGLRDPSSDTPPVIASVSSGQTATAGQSVSLSVSATGTPTPTYQWYRNGFVVSGATSSTLTLNSVSTSSAGSYTVTVSNALGATTSPEIVLTVSPSLNQRGLLTATARAETGAAIAGTFTIEGTTSKQILVRAIGPALGSFGVPGVLADPFLTITTANGTVLGTNDDWNAASNASQISTVSQQVGAYALPSGGKDAAILRSFAPGTYHARVTAAGSTAGVSMLEIYDADSYPRTVYIATNAFAGVGGKVFVQGFAVAGAPAGRSYLIRALGPSLGSGTALADPQLAVFNSAGMQLAANDDWAGDATLASLADSVGAMPLAPTSKDAVVNFVPPSPGVYTVQVGSATGATGNVLVEIFESDAQRAPSVSAAIVAQPQDATALPGTLVKFGVAVVGKPTPTFQWRKNGLAIANATDSTFSLPSAQVSDAGDYSVIATNAGGTVTSSAATLAIVSQLATHSIVGHGYIAGGIVTISNTFSYSGDANALGWRIDLPTGWSYAGGGGVVGDVKPAVGATGTLEWAWTSPPTSPVTFTYTLNVPAGEIVSRNLSATALMQVVGSAVTTPAAPSSLVVGPAPSIHSADTDRDGTIGLTELLRVIELYNTRSGTSRTGQYSMQDGTEDGYVSGPGGGSVTVFHSADTDHDGKIGLTELLRVIELYNCRSGTTRTGQYHQFGGSEDGFASGP